MAPGTKGPSATATTSNGAAAAAAAAVNRKKQKRREKEAAKKAAHEPPVPALPAGSNTTTTTNNGLHAGSPALAATAAAAAAHHARQPAPQYAEPDPDDAQYDDEPDFYSDDDVEHYDAHSHTHTHAHAYPPPNGHYQHPYAHPPIQPPSAKKSRRKKRASQPPPPPPLAYSTQHVVPRHNPQMPAHARSTAPRKDRIWNTSTQEERERIREFWLSLGEDERKSLVKIEKEAVLRKMKEQQKHSCSCSVCGRKRTAIEEELEVLYDAYYEELEHAPHPRPLMTTHPPPAPHGHHYTAAAASAAAAAAAATNDDDEEEDDEEEDDDEEYSGDEEEDYSNSDISSEADYSSEDRSLPPPEASDFLHFGSSLQVKGGILTVADDLLKNDGKKFIEMMEQLAERRMQREEEAQYQAHPSMYQTHGGHGHAPPPEEDDFDDEGDEEEGYEDDDYEEDDEDEDDTMTEEQRMEEGRRMFQIFAARMFEQRVLQAYREKVAAERQQRLLEELAEEDERKDQKEAKKLKEAQKRKEKKEKQRQQKAEEKARKDAEQAAKEAELKAAEEKRLEEQRKKREEQRRKKEAERKAQEEEKQRKEAERQRRQQEERERQQETERKAREAKAQEKKAKEEAKRKEREEREAKEKEARDKRIQEDKERKERDAKAKADKQAAARKASQPPVALPPQLLKQTSSSGMPSPLVTPALPKAPTPNRPRQTSQQDSHNSSPNTPQAAPGTSKSMSPTNAHGPTMPKSILTKPAAGPHQNLFQHNQQAPLMHPLGPPPGMPGPPGLNMGGMPPTLNGFPGQGSMLPGMMAPRPGMPPFPPQLGAQNFRGFPPPGMPMGRGFPMDGPPGFGPMPGFGGPTQIPGFGMGMSPHSRQGSGSFDRLPSVDSPISGPHAQPIQRPTPIKRPSSNKATDDESRPDVDDLADHLGSKALLDDAEDIPEPPERRASVQQHGSFRGTPMGFGFADAPIPSRNDSFSAFGAPGGNIWGTPPMPFSLGSGASWGNSPTSGFFNNPFPIGNVRTNERGPNEQRIVWLRRMVCTACKMVAARQPTQDGYVDALEVHQQIDNLRNPSEAAVTPEEIKEACDIIDIKQTNGGGSLEYKESGPGRLSHIKFVEMAPPPATLGEIGSPVPGHSVLVGGFGNPRPFPGLGPQGF